MAEKTKKVVITRDLPHLTFTLHEPVRSVDGTRVKWAAGTPRLVCNLNELSNEMTQTLLVHGAVQKVSDAGAGESGEDFFAAARAVWENLVAGNWATRGEGVERTTLFVQAYATLRQKDVAEIRARINAIESGDDDAAKANLAAWRKDPRVLEIMAKLQAEAARERQKAAKEAAKNAPELADF